MAADLIEAVPIDLWLLDDVGLLREIAAAAERARNEAVETIEAEFVDGDNEDEEYDETLQEYTRGYNVPYRIMNVIADIQALKLQQAQVGGAPAQEQATDDVDVVLADRLSSGVVDPVGPEV
ncbi:unnamed protein product [Amoebophrya sp. A120]|nr:unnamed protein product [Amoebophrya sp. A120]|eukprot:GSA120T00022388001.1